jgi:hypothetical protein
MRPQHRTLDAPRSSGLHEPHHYGYVVDDLERAAEQWAAVAGVGPFLVLEHVAFDEFTVDGQPALLDHSAAFAAFGDQFVELQVVHDFSPAATGRLFRAGQPGNLNHVAFAVADPAAESERLSGNGVPLVVRARTAGLGIVLHDVSAELGFAVELHQDGEALRGLFEQVRRAALGWDGREPLRQFDLWRGGRDGRARPS